MTSSVTTFEILPDEILMIVVRYCGNAYTIFRAFTGLNQRLNNILVDRRLHLFINLLYININDPDFHYYYYNSDSFREICSQFLSLKITDDNDKQLHQCLQSLIVFYIQEKYKRMGHEFQAIIKQCQSIRTCLTPSELNSLDDELKSAFKYLPVDLCPQDPYCVWEPWFSSKSIMNMKQIESLVLIQGARLECDDEQEFNFAMATNKWLLAKANLTRSNDQRLINSLIQMFKVLLISNPMLLKTKDYTHYPTKSRYAHYFLLYSIYRLRYFHDPRPVPYSPIEIHWYKALVDLFLFVIHCLNHTFDEEFCLEDILLDILSTINLIEPSTHHGIFIHTSQMEILRIILYEYDRKSVPSCDRQDAFSQVVYNLVKNDQLNIIRFSYSESERARILFHRSKPTLQIIDSMTGNRKKRQLFQTLLSDGQFKTWLTSSDLLFILLQKKECKLVKHLLKLSPLLVHQLDEDGNDALLYVCLKVRGCRHHLVGFLIKAGCDLQRRNSKNENFIDALQLVRNRNLLEKLNEHETIEIDDVSAEIKVILAPLIRTSHLSTPTPSAAPANRSEVGAAHLCSKSYSIFSKNI